MAVPVQAVLFLGIIPALVLLFIALKGYEGLYKDKSIFLSFVIGIIFGVIAAVIRLLVNTSPLIITNVITYISGYTLIYIIIYAFFEQLIKTLILNIGRLQFKKATVIYGLTLGLGFGSSFTPFLIIAGSAAGQSSASFIALVTFGSLGFILFNAASGAYIGYGVFSGNMTKYLFIAIFLQIPFNSIAELTRFYIYDIELYFIIYQFGLVLYGLIFFIYVIKKILPKILTQTERRKRTKKIKQKKVNKS